MMKLSLAFLSAILVAPFAALLAVSVSPTARAADYIWIGGESPRAQTMARHPWWYDNNNHGMLDCFVLAGGPFAPDGKRKPGEKSADD